MTGIEVMFSLGGMVLELGMASETDGWWRFRRLLPRRRVGAIHHYGATLWMWCAAAVAVMLASGVDSRVMFDGDCGGRLRLRWYS